MKALFNGTCDRCRKFRPRCALVGLRDGRDVYGDRGRLQHTLCDGCRRALRGLYRLHPQHRRGRGSWG
jgi:hypothetical protein